MVHFFNRSDLWHHGIVLFFGIVLILIERFPAMCYNPILFNSQN
jgi:hypothetical protein